MDDSTLSKSEAGKALGLKHMREAAFVAGQWVNDGDRLEVDDPAEEAVFGSVPKVSASEVDRAVQAAADAFPAWSGRRETDRAEFLRRWADLIDRDLEGLGALLAMENGKPWAEAKGEIAYANQFNRWFAGEAERMNGDIIPSPLAQDRIATFKQAVGLGMNSPFSRSASPANHLTNWLA